MSKFEMKQIVSWIDLAIKSYDNENVLLNIKQKVKDLCSNFPIYDPLEWARAYFEASFYSFGFNSSFHNPVHPLV